MDSASDRLTSESVQRIEEQRMAAIFARDRKAYASWRRRMDRRTGRTSALSPKALDSAIAGLARSNPEYVVTG